MRHNSYVVIVEVIRWFVTVSPQMVNKSIFVTPVASKVVQIPAVIPTLLHERTKFSVHMKSGAVCAGLSAPLASHGIPSVFGLKKAAHLPDLKTTLVVPDPIDPDATTLELDELWSFVLKKTKQAWIWIALCRKTRQVVAYAIGDRSEATCRKLWRAIPKE